MPTDDEVIARQTAIVQAALQPRWTWKSFLESTPPNVSRKIDGLLVRNHSRSHGDPWSIFLPDIELFCETDGGQRFFASPESYLFTSAHKNKRHTWTFVDFTCKNCGKAKKVFSLLIDQPEAETPNCEVMKLGEFPPFGSPVSQRIQRLLGTQDLELYRQGMRSEAAGLGIGAATYFRRIVDNQWKQLVEELRDAAKKLGVTDLSPYEAALKQVSFKKAVAGLKDALPQKLLILDNQNPLTLLYHPLSVELHALTDEQCLQQAGDIRIVLTALLENIADVLKDQDELKGAVARLGQSRSSEV